MLDFYFRRPVLLDIFFGLILCLSTYVLIQNNFLTFPDSDRILSITSDISNIGLTSAGFILTLLTVLISFKSGSKITKDNYKEENSVFEIFFASKLYFTTTRILKNSIKSLILVSITGFLIKTLIDQNQMHFLLFFNVFSITIIGLTLGRCLLIFSHILKLQDN